MVRHHFLPQFYLRGFASGSGKIRVYRRAENRPPFETTLKNAAVESGLYSIASNDAAESEALEQALSKIEAEASVGLSILRRGGIPSGWERASLAVFLGFQIMRTPEQKRIFEVQFDRTEKSFYGGMTPAKARRRLADIGEQPTQDRIDLVMAVVREPEEFLFAPHPNEFLGIILATAPKVAVAISARSWRLGTSPGPAFVTGDHSVLNYSIPLDPPRLNGIGVGNADMIVFPVDRHKALLMPLNPMGDGTEMLEREDVEFINSMVTSYSLDIVLQHPDDPPLNQSMPRLARPLFIQNGEKIFATDNRNQRRLQPIFMDHSFRRDGEVPAGLYTQDEIIHTTPYTPPGFK